MGNKKELDYFYIENAYGGNQDWFYDYMMRMGGCGAVTACDSCIYLDLYKNTDHLYPYDVEHLSKKDYINFSKIMKPYLHPRWSGIDTLEIYMDGFGKYLSERGNGKPLMKPYYGTQDISGARQCVIRQIDGGFPIPFLLLKHTGASFRFYEWHWFLLTGYETFADTFMVKAVTYGSWQWLDLDALWDTGYKKKGGMVLFE